MSEAEGVGTILTGGLIAHEVDRHARGAAPSGHGHGGGACLNCGTTLAGDYCHACGQAGHVHRTMMSIVHDILHGVFHFEGRFWATLPMLVSHPGALTRRYIAGERAKFVSPMALFLFSVFLLFAAVNRVAMPDVAGVRQGIARAQDQMGEGIDTLRAKLGTLKEKRAAAVAEDPAADVAALDRQIAKADADLAALTNMTRELKGLSPVEQARRWDEKGAKIADQAVAGLDIATGSAVIDRQIEHVRENPELYAYKLKMASYKFSWALIPISVPLISLLFLWRRQYGPYDHAIFAIYSLSFMTLLAVGLIGLRLVGVRQAPLILTFLIAPPIHMYRQLKGAYRLGRMSAAWRTAALLMMTSIAGGLFFAMLLWLEAK